MKPMYDSPFPKLNPKVRYKTALERAGFDVNYYGSSPSSAGTSSSSSVRSKPIYKIQSDSHSINSKVHPPRNVMKNGNRSTPTLNNFGKDGKSDLFPPGFGRMGSSDRLNESNSSSASLISDNTFYTAHNRSADALVPVGHPSNDNSPLNQHQHNKSNVSVQSSGLNRPFNNSLINNPNQQFDGPYDSTNDAYSKARALANKNAPHHSSSLIFSSSDDNFPSKVQLEREKTFRDLESTSSTHSNTKSNVNIEDFSFLSNKSQPYDQHSSNNNSSSFSINETEPVIFGEPNNSNDDFMDTTTGEDTNAFSIVHEENANSMTSSINNFDSGIAKNNNILGAHMEPLVNDATPTLPLPTEDGTFEDITPKLSSSSNGFTEEDFGNIQQHNIDPEIDENDNTLDSEVYNSANMYEENDTTLDSQNILKENLDSDQNEIVEHLEKSEFEQDENIHETEADLHTIETKADLHTIETEVEKVEKNAFDNEDVMIETEDKTYNDLNPELPSYKPTINDIKHDIAHNFTPIRKTSNIEDEMTPINFAPNENLNIGLSGKAPNQFSPQVRNIVDTEFSSVPIKTQTENMERLSTISKNPFFLSAINRNSIEIDDLTQITPKTPSTLSFNKFDNSIQEPKMPKSRPKSRKATPKQNIIDQTSPKKELIINNNNDEIEEKKKLTDHKLTQNEEINLPATTNKQVEKLLNEFADASNSKEEDLYGVSDINVNSSPAKSEVFITGNNNNSSNKLKKNGSKKSSAYLSGYQVFKNPLVHDMPVPSLEPFLKQVNNTTNSNNIENERVNEPLEISDKIEDSIKSTDNHHHHINDEILQDTTNDDDLMEGEDKLIKTEIPEMENVNKQMRSLEINTGSTIIGTTAEEAINLQNYEINKNKSIDNGESMIAQTIMTNNNISIDPGNITSTTIESNDTPIIYKFNQPENSFFGNSNTKETLTFSQLSNDIENNNNYEDEHMHPHTTDISTPTIDENLSKFQDQLLLQTPVSNIPVKNPPTIETVRLSHKSSIEYTESPRATVAKEEAFAPSSTYKEEENASVAKTTTTTRTTVTKYPPGQGPCRRCGLEVTTKAIFSKNPGELSGQWHRECFKCEVCETTFNKKTACYILDDMPYCKQHYHEKNGSICRVCHLAIEGECLENDNKERFHVQCLVCFICHNPITNDYYLFNGSVPLCDSHDMDALLRDELEGLTNPEQSNVTKRRTRLINFGDHHQQGQT